MDQLRPKTGNTLKIMFFSLFLLILFLPNVSNKYYHDILSDQLYEQHKRGMASVAWENIVSAHGEAMA